ncbi:MAG: glycosyl hydrolase [Saprospiraceae bacterium]|nr:glycosyl hydrolase [Saprospiraceae bacterium]
MKHFIIIFSFLISIFPAFSQHTNIMISNQYNPEEPSIMINPKNTNQIVAGSNLKNYFYSDDAGITWNVDTMISSYGVWGDPCIIADTNGDFYFFHLSNPPFGNWIDRIVCQKLDSFGGSWNDGTFMGLNGTKAQDKEWAIVDPATNIIYITWTQFDDYDSHNPNDSSVIMFSRSINQGQSWSPAKRINKIAGDCVDSDSTAEGAVPAVGPNGEVYVSWAGLAGLVFDKSLDSGNTWLQNDILIDSFPGGWNFDIPGISRCNGLPITVCDLSGGSNHGTIYVNWTDQRNGTTDTDVWLSKSTDGGNTWSPAKRVNDDPAGKQQFFTWMAVDQITGYLYFVFYDRRNYTDNKTDVYMAQSKDGGNTFINFKISESPFVPFDNIFFGDYTNISAHNNVVRPIWTRLHNGDLSVWTALINVNVIGIESQESINLSLEQNYPNPFSSETYFAFKLHKNAKINLLVYDVFGCEVARIIDGETRNYGKYIEKFEPESYSLNSGVYYFSLQSSEANIVKKMIYVK